MCLFVPYPCLCLTHHRGGKFGTPLFPNAGFCIDDCQQSLSGECLSQQTRAVVWPFAQVCEDGKYNPIEGAKGCTLCEAGKYRGWKVGSPKDPLLAWDCNFCTGKGLEAPVCPLPGMHAPFSCGHRAEPWRPANTGLHGNTRCHCNKRFYGYSSTTETVPELVDNSTLTLLHCARCPQGTLCNQPGRPRAGL